MWFRIKRNQTIFSLGTSKMIWSSGEAGKIINERNAMRKWISVWETSNRYLH